MVEHLGGVWGVMGGTRNWLSVLVYTIYRMGGTAESSRHCRGWLRPTSVWGSCKIPSHGWDPHARVGRLMHIRDRYSEPEQHRDGSIIPAQRPAFPS